MTDHFTVSVAELQEKHEAKCKMRIDTFHKILDRCYRRVKSCADKGATFCLFLVPEFMMGVPTYSMVYCAAFLIMDLKNKGYYASFYNPNVILIKWSYIPDKNPPPAINVKKEHPRIELDRPYIKPHSKPSKPEFKSINSYRPTGKFLFE